MTRNSSPTIGILSGFRTSSQTWFNLFSPWSKPSFAFLRGGTRNSPVLADPPEVDRHKDGGDQRKEDAMANVEAEQRRRSYLRAAEENKPHIVVDFHPQLRPERSLITK